jgi:hypothetical protein
MSEIIPFGKYKGQPIEVLMQDKQYLEWLQCQDWFKNKYQTINTLIINNFQEPSETPEHNKLQAMFTDEQFCIKVASLSNQFINFNTDYFNDWSKGNLKQKEEKIIDKEITSASCKFERNSIDVELSYSYEYNWHWGAKGGGSLGRLLIELKPEIGDDYPAILRQMHNNKSFVLITERYTGKGATLEQFKKIFAASNIQVIFLHEII